MSICLNFKYRLKRMWIYMVLKTALVRVDLTCQFRVLLKDKIEPKMPPFNASEILYIVLCWNWLKLYILSRRMVTIRPETLAKDVWANNYRQDQRGLEASLLNRACNLYFLRNRKWMIIYIPGEVLQVLYAKASDDRCVTPISGLELCYQLRSH